MVLKIVIGSPGNQARAEAKARENLAVKDVVGDHSTDNDLGLHIGVRPVKR